MVLIKVIAIHPNSLSSPVPHPCHSLIFSRDHLRSPSGIISGPGSFAVLGSFTDPYRSCREMGTVTRINGLDSRRNHYKESKRNKTSDLRWTTGQTRRETWTIKCQKRAWKLPKTMTTENVSRRFDRPVQKACQEASWVNAHVRYNGLG